MLRQELAENNDTIEVEEGILKKKIWLWNHYATNMFFNEGGRHYWFAQNLINQGYDTTIFCASTRHNFDSLELAGDLYSIKKKNNIPFVFVKATKYTKNGIDRVINMLSFYKNLFTVSDEMIQAYGKPDVIIASTVHPLTLVAGIKVARKYSVKCICEVRDLWPETFVAYGIIGRNNPFLKMMYIGERWIYKKADKLVFTMEGGKDYIIEKKWDKASGGSIDLDKVYHVNNGVDLESFNYNKKHYTINDKVLEGENLFKVVYTGSIRAVNNVMNIVQAAEVICRMELKDIVFIIYGDGPEKEVLEQYCLDNNVDNIIFKGRVEKKYIPYVLSKSDLNIFHFKQSVLKRYGASLNKMFEYFASGKPTLADCEFRYDLIKKYNAGLVLDMATPEELAGGIIQVKNFERNKYDLYCENAKKAASDYDFKKLVKELINIIEE